MNERLLEERRELQREVANWRRALRTDLEAHEDDRAAWRHEIGAARQRLAEIEEEWELPEEPRLRRAALELREHFPAFMDVVVEHRKQDKAINGAIFEDHGVPMVVACCGCEMTMVLFSAVLDQHGRCWCEGCAGDFEEDPERSRPKGGG
jgi:hypothetical protein